MVFRHFEYAKAKNTHHMGKYHSTADLLFDWFGFDQTSKADANSTKAKQLKPNKIYKRSAIQCSLAKHSFRRAT